ncbi:MAG: alpha-2-macroglobulin [Gammaproteobacteria bacterium RIFCSPLOWO2_02_FULL_61_13]|nr:MAG: alpha-2-macroglobulin [Gammaproteobacteria bacterium RIFCSPLOWO2_02_FULL_61_13]
MHADRLFAPFLFLTRWVGELFVILFGTIHWQAPRWWRWSADRLRWAVGYGVEHRAVGLGALAVALGLGAAAWFGWLWYQNLPEPHTVDYTVEAPASTDYEKTPVVVSPSRVRFAESVAPLAHIGKPVTTGVNLKPALAGTWRWVDDRTLEFMPAGDWPVDGAFALNFARKEIFNSDVLLAEYDATFKTAAFSAQIGAVEFYQDPGDGTLKKLVATVDFSHPVDEARLRSAIEIRPGPGLQYRDAGAAAWTLTLDKTRLHAYVHSAPFSVPLESVPLTLFIARNLRAADGGAGTDADLEQEVVVPGRYQLTFTDAAMSYVDNERDEPEQVLMFDSAFPVTDDNIHTHVQAWVLPEMTPDKSRYWSTDAVSEDALRQAASLTLQHIPGAERLNSHHSFRFRAPVRRFIYVRITPDVEAIGGYLSKKAQVSVFQVDEYPQTLKLIGSGALLSLNGDKKLGFMAQGLPGVRVEIARLLPNQLHHLVDLNSGSFGEPDLFGANIDRLVERRNYTRDYTGADPAKPIYDYVDLTPYLEDDGARRGIFVLRLTPYDAENPKREYSEYPGSGTATDRRFILVTDLGIINKRTLDGSLEVFVQSIATGQPVAGAKVEVLGRNGLPVLDGITDADGHASFPKVGELRREKSPIMVVVSQGADLSFLPLTHGEHRLDFSRFDIGGRSDVTSPDQLSAYVFTDRGLYRPGETAHIAFIVRTAAFTSALAGVPVDVEITDPRGAVVFNERRSLPASGLDTVDFSSSDVAPAGDYSANLYLVKDTHRNAQLGAVGFKVRDFEPDRLKVNLTLAGDDVTGWAHPDTVQARVLARHLFGAPAPERRVTAEMRLSPTFPAFTRYPDYRFHVNDVLKDAVKEDLPETRTDAAGAAELDLGLKRFARNTYQMHVTARVFEAQGGRNVAAEKVLLVSSAPFLVGLRTPDPLDYVTKNAVRNVHFLALGPDLNPMATPELSLARIEFQHVSVLMKQNNGVYKYESQRREIVRETESITLPAAGSEIALPTGEPGDFGYILRDDAGNELNRVTWSVAGAGNVTRSLERNAELQMRLDRASYVPGESISINIRAPFTGSGLITIERERIFAQRWFKTDTTSSVQTIEVPAGLEGNAYVNVQFVRDPASKEVYMSPLSYAVAPFAVNLDARTLQLTVSTPEVIEPGQKLTMHVTAGAPARGVVFAIDEGILQVARYKTPDPLGHFFQKRALQVDTTQILNLILPEFSRLMEASAPGGDSDGALGRNLNPFKRKRQAPVAYWSGIVELPAGGSTLEYTVPDSFNGKLRVLAVALTEDRIGVFGGTTEVRGPWVLTPNVPAFVAPGDEFDVSVGIFSNLDQNADVTLELGASAGLKVIGKPSVSLSIDPQREGVAEFRLLATDALGSADLKFTSASPATRATISETLSVRPATPYRVELRAGQFDAASHRFDAHRTLHDQLRKVELGLDHSPLVWAQGLTHYLENYPYSCTEQLVSKALPALVWATPEELAAGDLKAVRAAFSVLRQRQNAEGGFGLWAANPVVEPEVSVHAADFLMEARERGVAVPPDLLAHTRDYLERLAGAPAEDLVQLRTRAQAAYLLTRMGVITTGSLAGTSEQLEAYHSKVWRKDIVAAYIAAGYKLLKQDRDANKLFAKVPWHEAAEPGDANDASYGTYYDALGHDAQLLTLMARHFPERLNEVPATLLDGMGKRLTENRYNSLTAAQLVRALDLYGKGVASQGGTLTALAELQDKTRQPLAFIGKPPRAPVPQGFVSVQMQRSNGDTPAFYVISEAGFDRTTPAAELRQGLEITRDYLNLDGEPLTQVRVGDEFLVRLRMRTTERDTGNQIAIVDLLPGGVEPVFNPPAEAAPDATPGDTEGMEEEEGMESEDTEGPAAWRPPIGEPDRSDWHPDYADVRDDRVVLYGNLSHDAGTMVYRVRATNAGAFTAPPPYVEGMYDRTMQGRGTGATLTITKP